MKWETLLKTIGPLLFVYLLLKIDFSQLSDIIKDADLFYFFLSLVFWFVLIFIRTSKWKAIIDCFLVKVPFKELFPMFAKGIFWGLVTPARLGEFYRVKYLQEKQGFPLKKSLWTVVLDRIIDLFGALFLSSVLLVILVYLMEANIPLAAAITLAVMLLLFFFFFLFQSRAKALLFLFLKVFIPRSLRIKTEDLLEDFFLELKRLKVLLFLKLFGYELLCYLSMATAHFFLARSLGLSIPFWYLYLIDAFVVIAVSLPISVFGLGTREVSYIFLLAPFGINMNEALMFSLMALVLNIFIGMPGLLFVLLERKWKT